MTIRDRIEEAKLLAERAADSDDNQLAQFYATLAVAHATIAVAEMQAKRGAYAPSMGPG